MIDEWTNQIHQGHAVAILNQMPESSVHCVVTSPPYYGLRDYGDDTITVWGGDESCDHAWEDRDVYQESPVRRGAPDEHETTTKDQRWRTTGRCEACGARREQLGLEEQLEDYIGDLAQVGQSIARVLRDDGVWWLNLGDTFASRPGWGSQSNAVGGHDAGVSADRDQFQRKQKMLVPHRVAIRLQQEGWLVRSDAVWAKPNPMPDPAKDRLREDKEYLFQLTQQQDYYFDLDAIREPHKEVSLQRSNRKDNRHEHSRRQSVHSKETLDPNKFVHPNGKNPGDIFEITVQPFPEAHFAVYPPELVEKPIKSSSPKGGIVLDPFAGAGTTCLAAKQLGRRFIGVDLNPEYVAMAQARVGVDVDRPDLLTDRDQATLADGGFTPDAEPRNAGER